MCCFPLLEIAISICKFPRSFSRLEKTNIKHIILGLVEHDYGMASMASMEHKSSNESFSILNLFGFRKALKIVVVINSTVHSILSLLMVALFYWVVAWAFSTAVGLWTNSCLHSVEDTCLQFPRKSLKACKQGLPKWEWLEKVICCNGGKQK